MILIADDAEMFRELGALFLARTGRVVTAGDGFEALDVIAHDPPNVIVADLDMPRMAGDALCVQLKANPELCDIPVILVTGSGDAADRARAVRAGADDVIAKPIRRIALIQAVNRFLRTHPVRGLARVPLETTVQVHAGSNDLAGTIRNLSRGGVFVETDARLPPETEVALEFGLPDGHSPLVPTAQVIWSGEDIAEARRGMGLQFLAVDRRSAERIDAFVYENLPSSAPAAMGMGGGR
jgi:two-component system cell cycle response regulator